MSMGQPLKIPFNLIPYHSAQNCHCLVAHMVQVPTCTQGRSSLGLLGLDVNLALAGCKWWMGNLGHSMRSSRTQTSHRNSCAFLGFLGNADTRDRHGEEGMRNFQHFTGGSRPRGSLFLDLEHGPSAHSSLLLAICWDLTVKWKEKPDTLKTKWVWLFFLIENQAKDDILYLGIFCTKK